MYSLLILFIAGAVGALVKEILEDNKIVLPKKINGELCLGFLGSVFIGGVVGYLVDNDPVTAALAGFTGLSAIESLLLKKNSQIDLGKITIAAIIRSVAATEEVDPDLAVKVAKCESNLSPTAVNMNRDGSQDRGLFQINDKFHPEVSNQEAFDIVLSTRFFCKAFKAGNLSWWNCTKDCWEK